MFMAKKEVRIISFAKKFLLISNFLKPDHPLYCQLVMIEELRDPDVACTFQATIGGKFAPLTGLSDEDLDMDTMITTYNTAVTDAASEILGKERRRKKPLVTKDVLDLCDERRDLKKQYEAEGAKEYREASRRIQKAVKKAKEDWIGAQCEEIETCLNKNNSKRAYQLV